MAIYYAEGRYVCKVLSQDLTVTANGNLQFALRVRVLGTPDPAKPDNYIPAAQQFGRTFYRVLNNKTFEFAMKDLAVLGFTGGGFGRLDPRTPGFHNFADLVVDLYCKHETYNGNSVEQWNVASVAKPTDGAVKAAALARLDELVAARAKGGTK